MMIKKRLFSMPLHLEFDSSGSTIKDRTYHKTHQSWRIEFGGYAGARLKKRNKYCNISNHDVIDKYKGGFNTSNFIYGLSTTWVIVQQVYTQND
jgi:hypothetical protein